MSLRSGQTAVVIEIPEAQDAVGAWRTRFDTSAAVGVPPHVTIVYPFLQLSRLTQTDLDDLSALFAAQPAFTTTFATFGTFAIPDPVPDVLYLAPAPDTEYRRMIAAMTARWPQCPPYGGEFPDPTPHLTVTETAPSNQIAAARAAVAPALPIRATIRAGTLLAFDGTRWEPHARFPLGAGPADRPTG